MQQSTVCFSWRTASLRVGGRAARHSCLPGLRRGGGRQAGGAVLSCLVWRCELIAGKVRSASECVRRSHCAAQHALTRHRTHLSDGRADSVHTATPDTTKQSSLCRVWSCGVNCTIAINVIRRHVFSRRQSWVVGNPIHTSEADATPTRQFCRVWRGSVN